MAEAFTGTSALSNQVQAAYDRVAYFALRSMPQFMQLSQVKPGNVTNPGSSVSFSFWTEMTATTTALTETIDPDAVALASTLVSVTPAEYGNAVLLTRKLRAQTLLTGFDADGANLISYNMVDSLDQVARAALDGGTNVDYITGTTEIEQVSTSLVTADQIRQKHAELSGDSAIPFDGSHYFTVTHPDVGYDIKGETGDGAWVAPHQYVDPAQIYNNEIGTFGGFRFVESPRAKVNTDGGSSTVDTYTSYFMGREALGEVETIPGSTVLGPVTDKLMRFQPLGWYAFVGWDTVREAALRRLISASAIGSN